MFVSGNVRVLRSCVPEERFRQGDEFVYASDHLPIVADVQLPAPRRHARLAAAMATMAAKWRGFALVGGLAGAAVVLRGLGVMRGRK